MALSVKPALSEPPRPLAGTLPYGDRTFLTANRAVACCTDALLLLHGRGEGDLVNFRLARSQAERDMRTNKTLSISIPQLQLTQIDKMAKREKRSKSALVRDALSLYQQQQNRPVNLELLAAFRAVQQNAVSVGLDQLSSEEINAEIADYRRERRLANHK